MKIQILRLMPICFIVLNACSASTGTAAPSNDSVPSTPGITGPGFRRLNLESTSEQIQQAMLTSALTWHTIWMDGVITNYGSDGSTQTFREQVWIDQASAKFRIVLSGADPNTPQTLKISDGGQVIEMDLITGQSRSSQLPESARAGQFVPSLQPGVANPNPLWGQIGTHLSQLVFPSDFAQNEGVFRSVGLDAIAGRETLVMEWSFSQESLPSWKLWLDTETAVILKALFYQKSGGEPVQNERLVNQVIFDPKFEETLFTAPADLPQFEGAAPPVEGPAVTPLASEQSGSLGELYFFTLPHQAGQSAQMVRLPGECVVGRVTCPELETVPAPFPFSFNLYPLAWSPDGTLAAFSYSDNPNGTPTKLFIFDPAAGTWSSRAEFPYIDPPFWSPDGTWMAFRVQDGQGGENIYALRRDGTDLKNLTAAGGLPPEGSPYIMDGWLTENVLVRPALPGTQGGIYLLRASDGFVRPMFTSLLTKSAFLVSPDNAWLAFDDYDFNSQKHSLKVIEPDGANPLELVSFAGGNLYPLIWSPEASRLAFAHSSIDANFNPVSDVYVIGRDGLGMKQIYKGAAVGGLVFSPDGRFLLIVETTSPTGGHLFVVNLVTLEQHILSAPGLSLEADWYAPSWRP